MGKRNTRSSSPGCSPSIASSATGVLASARYAPYLAGITAMSAGASGLIGQNDLRIASYQYFVVPTLAMPVRERAVLANLPLALRAPILYWYAKTATTSFALEFFEGARSESETLLLL